MQLKDNVFQVMQILYKAVDGEAQLGGKGHALSQGKLEYY